MSVNVEAPKQRVGKTRSEVKRLAQDRTIWFSAIEPVQSREKTFNNHIVIVFLYCTKYDTQWCKKDDIITLYNTYIRKMHNWNQYN